MEAHYSYKDSATKAIKELDRQKFLDCETAIANLAWGYDIPLEFQLFLFHHVYSTLRKTLEEAYEEDKENLLSLTEIYKLIAEKVSEWEDTDKNRDEKLSRIDELIKQVCDLSKDLDNFDDCK